MRPSRLAALSLVVLLCVPASALKTEVLVPQGAGTAAGLPHTMTVTSGQALVRLSASSTLALLDAALGSIGAKRSLDLGGDWYLVHLIAGQSVATALPMLRALPGVISADPSRVYTAIRTSNDPSVNSQYALAQVSAFAAWEYETGSSSRVTIAVIDSGIDSTQPDLQSKLTNTTSISFDPNCCGVLNPPTCTNPCVAALNTPSTQACNHATHVAGVAAASTDNGTQIAGMSWGAQLVSIKVFLDTDCNMDCSNKGSVCGTNDPAIIAAINYATGVVNTAAYGRVVINMSLGASGACSGALQTAITNAVAAGVVIVAAAGNDGGAVNNPGNCAGVIPFGATDSNNAIAYFSSRGQELASNGLVAPGVSVLTTDVGGKTATATGTSFASPMGAGLAALILAAKPTLTPAQVQTYMRAGAEDIGRSSSEQGAGRMNAYRSMRLAVKGTLLGFDGEQKPIAFPNPFRVSSPGSVNFSVPPSLQGSDMKIRIYTLEGQLVREVSGLVWDGKNADGNLVASGTYVFSVKTSKGLSRGRMAVIR